MATVLVMANETIGGEKLLDAIRRRHEREPGTAFHVVVPKARPRHGNVIYDDAVESGAQVRVDLALAFMREEGIQGTGEVGDGDPFNAAMDCLAERRIDEILISTLPPGSSGWLKRDLPARLEAETGLPVEHVVVDLAREGLPFDVTLVLANQTVAGSELSERLKALAAEGPRRFIVVVPQDSGDGTAAAAARRRLDDLLSSLAQAGIVAAGMIGDPDPYTAALNALEYFHISEVVVSTLPADRSAWLADKIVERVAKASNLPVEHVETRAAEAAAAEA